jgi:hypothetical protein
MENNMAPNHVALPCALWKEQTNSQAMATSDVLEKSKKV